MKPIFKIGFFALVILFFFSGCEKEDPESVAKRDREKILEYIEKNDLDAEEHETGLFYVIDVEGSGGHPHAGSRVVVNFKGYLLDGKVFDEGQNFQSNLAGTIEGWRVGIPLFKRGGKGMLLVPSAMGYGPYGMPGIPRSSVLIFDIELIDFN